MESPPTRRSVLPDLAGLLPKGVWPTPLRVLENNRRFLFIREYGSSDQLGPVHELMWKRLAGAGDISVLCVWGIPPATREAMQLFDHRGMQPILEAKPPVTNNSGVEIEPGIDIREQFRQAVLTWWREADTA
jgi:hypothetical protein